MCDIIWFKDCSHSNKNLVGGKCCSLGELYSQSNQCGFSIADGFAITTTLYDNFICDNKLDDMIRCELDGLDIENIRLLEIASEKVKKLIIQANFSKTQAAQIVKNYKELCALYKQDNVAVAVRSSAIAEDMPNASFAGQQDTYLNIAGDVHLLESIKRCFASLYNGRAISYRKTHNIQAAEVKMSVAIQKMVRSDIGSAGVAFSMDPETGYNKAVVINSSFGLGELVVSGGVRPDEYILDKRVLKDVDVDVDADPIVAKTMGDKNSKIIYSEDGGVKEVDTTDVEKTTFSLTNGQAVQLARFVLMLEGVYSGIYDKQIGVDVEWAVDGLDNRIYIIQTRPETIHSNSNVLEISRYRLTERSDILIRGVAVGDKISSGKIKILTSIFESDKFTPGDILVTEMTTPDWEPIMKISSGVITNKGGRTCHAAIVARELGLNAIVGTGHATDILRNTEYATISCAEGEQGIVYNGCLPFDIEKIKISNNLKLPIKLMLNVGNPENSFNSSIIPSSGVGLARLEFIISNYIKIHPIALCDYPNIKDDLRDKIREIIGDNKDGRKYFIKRLARGMAKIASAFYPHKVIVRLSDFKSNEYKNLIGGELYEPNEENPMIGWRGASRYYSPDYERGFELECAAIKYAREKMKMDNVVVMIPFCRTPHECQLVLNTMEKYGLKRGVNKLEVYLMCEIPSNVIEADKFAPMVDGVSIGGNDLLQLTLGVDRDSEKITYLSNDENLSYRRMISMAIHTYKEHGVKVGFCGQQPSDSIEFCRFLIEQDIDSISVTPDSALKTIKNLGIEDK